MRTWFLVVAAGALFSVPAWAQEAPPAPPPPYSLPWQLRPAAVATVVRSDTAMAFYSAPDPGNESGTTIATTLLGAYKLTPAFAPVVRVGLVSNSPPVGDSAQTFANPIVGGTYLLNLNPSMRLALFLGLSIPVGMGGGNDPDPAEAMATASGVLARSSMDNAMFAVNDFTVFPGVGFAFVHSGFTAQVEATVLQLTRVRGEDVQPDDSKTNLTSGIHLGYFVIPQVSIGADLRYQRWLSTPKFVDADDTRRDVATVAVGPRVHLKLSDAMWIRPGIGYARGLDEPMSDLGYDVVQIDVPVQF